MLPWVPQHLDLQLQPPLKLSADPPALKLRGTDPAENEAGAHLMISVRVLTLASLLCSLTLLKTPLILPLPPRDSPHSSREPLGCLATPRRLPAPQLALHLSAVIFLLFVSQTKLPSHLYPTRPDFQELPICWGGGKVTGAISSACFRAAKWPHTSNQESDCWTRSARAEEPPAKAKARPPASPLHLGLQQPPLQT